MRSGNETVALTAMKCAIWKFHRIAVKMSLLMWLTSYTPDIVTNIEIAVICDNARLKSFGDSQDGSIYCLLSITIYGNLIL